MTQSFPHTHTHAHTDKNGMKPEKSFLSSRKRVRKRKIVACQYHTQCTVLLKKVLKFNSDWIERRKRETNEWMNEWNWQQHYTIKPNKMNYMISFNFSKSFAQFDFFSLLLLLSPFILFSNISANSSDHRIKRINSFLGLFEMKNIVSLWIMSFGNKCEIPFLRAVLIW